MKISFIFIISGAQFLSSCAGGSSEKSSVESVKADSLVKASLAQKENELKRANDSIINAKAVANADSVQKFEKEHGRINTYENSPVRPPVPEQGGNARPVPTPQNGVKAEENVAQRVTPATAPVATDHLPPPNGAGRNSAKGGPVKK